MIQLKQISVRPMDHHSVSQFFDTDFGIKDYIKNKFITTNKLINVTVNISNDYSTETKIFTFKTEDAYYEFINDEILSYQEKVLRSRYNKYHSITTTLKVTEVE